jgi:hypothetical protein
MATKKPQAPAPKIGTTRLPDHPSPKDPDHDDWKVDEADDESFPASDPSSVTQPGPKDRGSKKGR